MLGPVHLLRRAAVEVGRYATVGKKIARTGGVSEAGFQAPLSTNEAHTLLFMHLGLGFRSGWELQYGCRLTFRKAGQQHDVPVWEFDGVVMGCRPVFVNLSEDCSPMFDSLGLPSEQAARHGNDFASKCQLGAW